MSKKQQIYCLICGYPEENIRMGASTFVKKSKKYGIGVCSVCNSEPNINRYLGRINYLKQNRKGKH